MMSTGIRASFMIAHMEERSGIAICSRFFGVRFVQISDYASQQMRLPHIPDWNMEWTFWFSSQEQRIGGLEWTGVGKPGLSGWA